MSKIWLQLVNPSNLSLLHNFLQQYHQVYPVGTPIAAATDCDLYILDWPAFNHFKTELGQQRDRAQSVFLPVLLLAHEAEMARAVGCLSSTVDEVLPIPVKKWEALLRVNTLLRMRNLSVRLKYAYDREHAAVDELQHLNEKLQSLNFQLEQLAHIDGLTQVANRLALDECLHDEWQRLAREQQPLSLVLCDVDHFKAYNDRYGHPAGDRCLQIVAKTLLESVRRPADFVARYGGEEFAILLPNTELEGATEIVRIIVQNLLQQAIPHQYSPTNSVVTMSYGIACYIPHHQKSPQVLIQDADLALYQAKRQGRNQYQVQAMCNLARWHMVSEDAKPELAGGHLLMDLSASDRERR